MYNPLAYVLAILFAYRITALIVHDTIAEPLREFWWRRFPVTGFYYDTHVLSEHNNKVGFVKAWPVTRQVSAHGGGTWVSNRHYKLGELVDCMFCLSVWVAAGTTIFLNLILSLPLDGYTFLNFLAIAGGVEVTNNQLGRG